MLTPNLGQTNPPQVVSGSGGGHALQFTRRPKPSLKEEQREPLFAYREVYMFMCTLYASTKTRAAWLVQLTTILDHETFLDLCEAVVNC